MKSPWSSRQCIGLLDEKPGFEPQATHKIKQNTKSNSLAISSQQISGKNFERKIKLSWKVSQ